MKEATDQYHKLKKLLDNLHASADKVEEAWTDADRAAHSEFLGKYDSGLRVICINLILTFNQPILGIPLPTSPLYKLVSNASGRMRISLTSLCTQVVTSTIDFDKRPRLRTTKSPRTCSI